MKLDHFSKCPHVPQELKSKLEKLLMGSNRSSGMTVQYFVKSTREMGMVDAEEGVFIYLNRVGTIKEDQEKGPLPQTRRVRSQDITSQVAAGLYANGQAFLCGKSFTGRVLLALPFKFILGYLAQSV